MNFTIDEVKEMNSIQLEMLKAFSNACEQLKLKYYLVHGSLLGTIQCGGFIPYDDDIDIAMYRKDYEIFIREANKIVPDHIFLQSFLSDSQYPLPFAKLRNSNTTFSQTIMRNLNINQGIYIDIFPLDNFPKSLIQQKYLYLKEKIYDFRISDKLYYKEKQSFIRKTLKIVSKIICPSWEKAVKNKALLYCNENFSDEIIIIGGKKSERGIPKKWFDHPQYLLFEGFNTSCPTDICAYLSHIYGDDYKNYNPMNKYMNNDCTVSLSAEEYSSTISFKDKLKEEE